MDLTKYGNATRFPMTYILLRNYGFGGNGFEVATWADPIDEQRRARLVIGRTDVDKNAWGP